MIEPSHILHAILQCEQCAAYGLIARNASNIDIIASKSHALVQAEPVQAEIQEGQPQMSLRMKKSLEAIVPLVYGENIRAFHSGDILLGILREGTSPAAALLNDSGVTLAEIEAVIEFEGETVLFDVAVSGV